MSRGRPPPSDTRPAGSATAGSASPAGASLRSPDLLVFELARQQYGLRVADVREVLRAVAITRLPGAPVLVEGVVDVRGELIPVVDLRQRLGVEEKVVEPSDHLIVATANGRPVILRVDRVHSLVELAPGAVEDARGLMPEAEYIGGIARLPAGLVLIHDLSRFLSPAEETELMDALGRHQQGGRGR